MVPATLLRPFCQLPGCALDGIRAWTALALRFRGIRVFFFFYEEHPVVSVFDGGGGESSLSGRRSLRDIRRNRHNVNNLQII